MLEARDISGAIGVGVLIVTLFILLYRRHRMGQGGGYFLASLFALTAIEGYSTFQRATDKTYNTSPVYIIGIELVVFALLLFYFRKLLVRPVFRSISMAIILFFFIQYFLGAFLIDDFFTKLPFITYLLGVLCIAGSVILVLWQTFNSNEIFTLNNYFPFWACVSTLIIFIGVLPLLVARYYAGLNANIFYTTLFLVHVLGHLATIIGILKAKPQE